MQKLLIPLLLATLTLSAPLAAEPSTRPATDAPRLIAVNKQEDGAVIFRDGDVTTIVVTSPSGIGGLTLERVGQDWGKKIVVRFEYEAGRSFSNLEMGDVILLQEKPEKRVRLTPRADPKHGRMEAVFDESAAKFDRLEINWIDAFRR